MALTRQLTRSLTRSLTRKLTGAELQQLFLEKFKLTLGDELVVNGDFDTDSDWTENTGWSIGSNVASCDGSQSSGSSLESAANIAFVAGRQYTITYTLTISAGSVDARLQGGTAVVGTARTSAGTYTESLTAVSGNNKLRLRGSSSFVGTVDNVSVKEVTKQAPVAAFSLRKLGDVSPYAARIRRSSDNTEAQVMFDASDRVSEQSTVRNTSMNLLGYSEDLSQWTFVANSISITSDQSDPFGGQNAYLIQSISTSGSLYADNIKISSLALTAGKQYTASLYIKQGPLDGRLRVQLYDNPNSTQIGFVDVDFSASGVPSTHTSTSATSINYEAIGSDGWYRMSYTATNTTGTSNAEFKIFPDRQSGNDDVYAFGAMLEETVTYSSTYETTNTANFETDVAVLIAQSVGGTSTIARETSNPLTGSGSLLFTTSGSTNASYPRIYSASNGTSADDTLRLPAAARVGETYRVTMSTKLVSGSIKLLTVGFGDTNNVSSDAVVLSGTQAHTFEKTLTAVNTSTTLFFGFDGKNHQGSCLIDNIKIEKLPPIPSEYISTPVVSNDGLTFTESTLDTFVGGENLVPYSNEFTNSAWSNSSSVTANRAISPTGENNASEITAGDGIYDSVGSVGGNITISIHAKKNTASHFVLSGGYPTSKRVVFDLETGVACQVIGGATHTSESLGNGWFRFSVTVPSSSTDYIQFSGQSSCGLSSRVPGVYIYGAQINTGSTLKPYQETTGTARAGNASVVVLYNAVGGEDAIQATSGNQPLLYKGGLLVKSGTSAAMEFDGTNDYLPFSSDFNDDLNLNSLSASVVFQTDSPAQTAGILLFLGGSSGGNKRWYQPFINGSKFKYSYGTNHPATEETANTDHNIVTFVAGASGTSGFQVYRNGTHVNNHTATLIDNSNDTDPAGIGAYGQGSLHYKGKFQEAIIFDSDQKSNREAIESDIATAHNITLS